jgi:hypothetical protein
VGRRLIAAAALLVALAGLGAAACGQDSPVIEAPPTTPAGPY